MAKRKRSKSLRPKRITPRQRAARKLNMAKAREALKRGMRTSPKLKKAALKHIARTGSPGNIRTAQAAYKLSTGGYKSTRRRISFNPKFG